VALGAQHVQAAELNDAIANGLGLESAPLQRAMQGSQIPLAVATQGIEPLPTHEHDHDHGHAHEHSHSHGHHHHAHGEHDPHVWQDPVRMQAYARNIAQALIQADPAGKPHYEQRLAAYQSVDFDDLIGLPLRLLLTQPEVAQMQEHIASFLQTWLPRLAADHRSYVTVAIGCTGGQHRSVAIANATADYLTGQGYRTVTSHRDLGLARR